MNHLAEEGTPPAAGEQADAVAHHGVANGAPPQQDRSVDRVASLEKFEGTEVTDIDASTNSESDRTVVNPSDHSTYYAPMEHDRTAEPLNASSITIKGRADGVLIEIGRGSWSALMDELTERLRQAAGFFRGGKVTLNVGLRPLQEEELRLARSVLERFGMTLGVIRSTSEQTCQVALAFGLAASLDAPDGLMAQPVASNHDELQHFVYRGNLRSGQILRRNETILILGDVNPGAQVVSHGDILVWGRLRGIAHAGATGDEHAIIAALSMEPTQLRIAGLIAILPEEDISLIKRWFGRGGDENRPEIAYVAEQQIFVEPWDESKPGGIMAFRR